MSPCCNRHSPSDLTSRGRLCFVVGSGGKSCKIVSVVALSSRLARDMQTTPSLVHFFRSTGAWYHAAICDIVPARDHRHSERYQSGVELSHVRGLLRQRDRDVETTLTHSYTNPASSLFQLCALFVDAVIFSTRSFAIARRLVVLFPPICSIFSNASLRLNIEGTTHLKSTLLLL